MIRTHTTTVRRDGTIDLPFEWLPGETVTVIAGLPDGLWPGPDGTCFGPESAVPTGWQRRVNMDLPWLDALPQASASVVQCRPIPQPVERTNRPASTDAVQRVIDAARVFSDNIHGTHQGNMQALRAAVRALDGEGE
jgi:hypothetical protein